MIKPAQVKSYNDNTFRAGLAIPEIQSLDPIADLESARNNARRISESIFDNLSEFPYVYFTAGVTGALDYLLPRYKTQIRKYEYRYVSVFDVTLNDSPVAYYSYPFSMNGNFGNLTELCHGKDRVLLDCSYIFASDLSNEKIIPGNVTQIMFGISKSHNLFDARTGWFFSKEKLLTYHTLQYDYGYSCALYPLVMEKIVKYEPNYLYKKYKDKLSRLYIDNNLLEGNTNLFGTKPSGERVMYYEL